ncbi:MMPL family transporter [Paucibacter sp. Y2R2-4]|uniref:MMPL family transporter n=1 Tax=Paucibacter sp. Y2R2-4 TaxID=2893553 RepID=UPI0021E40FAD|nr:MMPL family transporter [Paucibacter sp. Y2R2-4]MCV2350882.1 transporter [Paucibacter sp. Y2R2-4]
MTETAPDQLPLLRRAAVWLLLCAVLCSHALWLLLGGRLQLDTDVLAMLPQDERQPAVRQATRALADAAARRVVVLVGAADWDAARQAGDAFAASLLEAPAAPITLRYQVGEASAEQWLGFFTPYQGQLLTAEQRALLQRESPDTLAQRAVESLYRPMGMPRIGSWQADPLNLFGAWLSERAGDSRVRVTEGRLLLAGPQRQYAFLTMELLESGFSMSSQQALISSLEKARAAALQLQPQAEVLMVGVPLHAAAAAQQAEHEVHTIGLGSLVGIIVLTLFAFQAIRPRLLVTLSIGVGLLCAISVTSLIFGRVHMITLVFGASLVGVAENYASNYYSGRLGRPFAERFQMLREQSGAMVLAMCTTAIGYALLALTPFPGLRQIAVFSVVGLLAAFITTLWCFPLFDRGEMAWSPFSRWIGAQRASWPVVGRNRFTLGFGLVLLPVLLLGLLRLQANDDIRLLQNSPKALLEQQRAFSALMDLPSPAQFYLVRGASEEEVLQREEALKQTLMAEPGLVSGTQAVSDWLPSQARQAEDAALLKRVVQGQVLPAALKILGEAPAAAPAPAFKPLLPAEWLAAPVSEPLRHQWLGPFEGGYASVVLLRGLTDFSKLPRLAALAEGRAGVQWVDKVGEVSQVLARYRGLMGGVIALSYGLVFAALTWRFGRRAWRALLPTLLASALALAIPALFGQPMQLFNVLALLLILGMGVDYGIFLLEQPARQALRPFLSVTLAAASTLLAFGLLALSGTPALRAFGLTMLLGIVLSWALTPLFMPEADDLNTIPT